MANLGDEAKAYEPQQTKNVADLEKIDVSEIVEDDEFDVEEGGKTETIHQKVLVRDGEKYRIPNSVLKSMKTILEKKPNLKIFQVVKQGEGLKTSYTVIPIE